MDNYQIVKYQIVRSTYTSPDSELCHAYQETLKYEGPDQYFFNFKTIYILCSRELPMVSFELRNCKS